MSVVDEVYALWKIDCKRAKKMEIEPLTLAEFVKAWSYSK